jgi:hypothetical protein
MESQMPIPIPKITGSAKRQSDIHASLARRGPTRNNAITVQMMAGGNVTANPITLMIAGKNGMSLSTVFNATIVNTIDAYHPAAQSATTTPSPVAHARLFGVIGV